MVFRELYETQFPFVWRTLRRLGVRDADVADAAQEVFVVVLRRLPSFEGRSEVTTWLFRIAYHVARDWRQRAHRRHEALDPEAVQRRVATDPNASELLEQRRDLELLDRALDCLDLEQRAVFTLFELEEMTGEQIAEAIEIPLGTVYSRLRLARAAFAKAIKRYNARLHSSALAGEALP
jgi:RNA polymerase sigma-70 factor (ECF subfamily)